MNSVSYIPSLMSLNDLDSLSPNLKGDENILFGEYGSFNPLAVYDRVKNLTKGKLLLEIISRNKNRNLIQSSLITASILGFHGVVLASGIFQRETPMAKPVYDLDPTQMLLMALNLRQSGSLRQDFIIALRSSSGMGPAETRARYLLEKGADYLVFEREEDCKPFPGKSLFQNSV